MIREDCIDFFVKEQNRTSIIVKEVLVFFFGLVASGILNFALGLSVTVGLIIFICVNILTHIVTISMFKLRSLEKETLRYNESIVRDIIE